MRVAGDDLLAIRQILGESQKQFAGRFSRCERQCRRWERLGVTFPATKPNIFLCRYTYREIWTLTLSEACERLRNNGYG